MPNSSTLASLSGRLAQKIQEDRQQIEAQTRQQLELHALSLKQLSDDALSITKTAINSRQSAIAVSLSASKQQIGSQQKELEQQIVEQTKRLIWLMRLPMLVTLGLCLLVCLLTWGYWAIASPIETVTAPDGTKWQFVKGANWQLCRGQPCRRSGTN